MGKLLGLAALVLAVVSLSLRMSALAHLVLLVPAALVVWLVSITWRPVRPCGYCDNGKDWDGQRKHYGEHCPGGTLGIGSCGGSGKHLRWEAKMLRAFGGGSMLRNLPDSLRGETDD